MFPNSNESTAKTITVLTTINKENFWSLTPIITNNDSKGSHKHVRYNQVSLGFFRPGPQNGIRNDLVLTVFDLFSNS